MGMAQTGGIASNGSGDYVIAFSTANRMLHEPAEPTFGATYLTNDAISPLFLAAIESTEEAVINSLFMAKTTTGTQEHKVDEIPKEQVLLIMKKYGRLKE